MINNDQNNGYETSELLFIALKLLKLQTVACKEVGICKIKLIAKRSEELRLELSISVELCCNDMVNELVVNALLFHTTTLELASRNKYYRNLKNLMDNLDDEFIVLIVENNYDFKNIVII